MPSTLSMEMGQESCKDDQEVSDKYGFPCNYLDSELCNYLERFGFTPEGIVELKHGCRRSCGLCTAVPSISPSTGHPAVPSEKPSTAPSQISTAYPSPTPIFFSSASPVETQKSNESFRNGTALHVSKNDNILEHGSQIIFAERIRPVYLEAGFILFGAILCTLGALAVRSKLQSKRRRSIGRKTGSNENTTVASENVKQECNETERLDKSGPEKILEYYEGLKTIYSADTSVESLQEAEIVEIQETLSNNLRFKVQLGDGRTILANEDHLFKHPDPYSKNELPDESNESQLSVSSAVTCSSVSLNPVDSATYSLPSMVSSGTSASTSAFEYSSPKMARKVKRAKIRQTPRWSYSKTMQKLQKFTKGGKQLKGKQNNSNLPTSFVFPTDDFVPSFATSNVFNIT